MLVGLLIALHVLAAVIWVGGMFFALLILRPAAEGLEGPARLHLWRRVFARFLPWVWCVVLVLLATGYWMLFGYWGGFQQAGIHLHLMNGLGLPMVALFVWMFFGPWHKFRDAVDAGSLDSAPGHLKTMRWVVTANLVLGLTTIVIGTAGRLGF